MANKVTIDVEARFIDNVTGEANSASSAFDKLEKEAKDAAKAVDSVGKKKPNLDVDTSKFKKAIDDSDKKLTKFGKTKAEAKLGAEDKATSVINRVLNKMKAFAKNPKAAVLQAKDYATAKIASAINKAKNFAGRTYSGMLRIRDSEALAAIRKVTTGAEKLVGKTWTAVVKIKDAFTSPLRALKNSLFNIRTLIAGIASAWAAIKFVKEPLTLADNYSSAKIGFSTLLGESAGQQMMDDLDAFAKKTPFNTSGVISNAQKMMAMGWDPERIIEDMETLGNAAAATGKGTEGLESIVRAMSQIKTKGRLSTEELNQLAEAGIAAKQMLAEQLGYGSGDEGIAKMTEDLEDGAIASNEAIEALLAGMKKYDGMMDSIANETVGGLKAQIQDAFEINIFRKWGQGLQDGAKRGFGTVIELLDEAEGALSEFGDVLYEIGKKASNWVADKFENALKRVKEITESFEFKEADLGEKISMLWKGVVADPLKEWFSNLWTDEENIEKATSIGQKVAEALTRGILAVLGITDIFAETGEGAKSKGSNIAQGFAKGFVEGFDVSAITSKIVEAIKNVWGALPTWAKIALGTYGAGKAMGGIGSFVGGVANFIGGAGKVVGGFNIASSAFPVLTSSGSGILGTVGKAGVALGASTTGTALLAGSAGIAGGTAGVIATGKGVYDLYGSYKAFKEGDETEGNAKAASGISTLSGVGMGAAAGAVIGGPLGALIGAGIGGIGGWLFGDNEADKIRAAKYESEEMKEAVADSSKSAEELAQTFEKAKWESAKEHFGDIKLSMEEISRLANQIVWGEDLATFDKLNAAVKQAEASLQSLNTAGEQTDRWMWKAGLGVKFNEDEIESIKASFDDYINSAKSFVENKQYEFTASVQMLVDIESEDGKSIIDSGNAYFAKIQEQLNNLGSQLSEKVEIALEDGVITLNEQKEITNLQKQIQEITAKLAEAESEAKLELIKLKFGEGNLDLDSFETFMATMDTTIQERLGAADTSFTKAVSTLKLELADGAITQEEYDAQLKALIEGYKTEVEQIKVDIMGVELEIIGEAYAEELGEDAAADLQKALEHCLNEGIDPIELDNEQLFKLLNVDSLSEETAANIKEMLSGVFGQMELLEVDGNLLLKIGEVTTEEDTTEKVKESVDNQVPDTVDETVNVNVTGQKIIETMDEVLADDFPIPESIDEDVILKLNASKTVEEQVNILASEFGISEEEAQTILWKLTGEKDVLNKITVTAADFGIPDSINKTVTVNITGAPNYAAVSGGGNGFRGGIFGGTSAMGSYARGGIIGDNIPGFSDGGIVRGGSQLIEVAEEGSPEMVIPLSSQRRGRALKLWAQAGNIMGVPGFNRGGIAGGNGNVDEGIRFHGFGADESAGGQTVQIEVGGIVVEIHVNASNTENIAEAIRAQANEIAETVAGIMADALGGQFENTPTRAGGVA